MAGCRVALALVYVVVGSTTAAFAADTHAVIELFTSQGCSSCPPADQLLGELAKEPGLIAMSLPIDYWDYLGWKDTLATPGHTVRQRGYAAVRGDRAVYTPQVVVNGTMHVQGSDKAAIDRAIAQTKQQPGTLSVPVSLSVDGGRIHVTATASPEARGSGDVWLCPMTKSVQVAIGRGENRGQTITYYNVARRWMKLGEWTGTTRSWSLPVSDLDAEHTNSVAVLVQAGEASKPGRMLGAASLALH